MLGAELVALHAGAAELAVTGIHSGCSMSEHPHGTQIDAETTIGTALLLDVYLKEDTGGDADLQSASHRNHHANGHTGRGYCRIFKNTYKCADSYRQE
jgi:hypothetical protein